MRWFWMVWLLLVPFWGEATVVSLKGYLGKEEFERAAVAARLAEDELLLVVDSTGGELAEGVEFAKVLYGLKVQKKVAVRVFIQENATGPAAIFPFLADELFTSYFVSWGDIPLGSQGVVPTNILRSTVRSFINPEGKDSAMLYLLAEAMSDPDVQVVDQNGWKIMAGTFPNVIAKSGETLVVNHNQLKALGVVKAVLTEAEFLERFKEKEPAPVVVVQDTLLEKLQKHVRFDPNGKNVVGLIQINERNAQISQGTWIYVKHALDYYKTVKPSFVILELNTPGGEVFAAQKISNALKELDTQYDIPVVCFINNWAISAGAMLAYSCRFISVVKDASMGAAEPVIAGEGGQMVAASEKVNSALRADFANRAGFFDRNVNIAEAMVDKDIILVKRHGKVVRLDSEDQIRKTGADPDEVLTPKGKLLTLSAEEMMSLGVADILLLPEKTDFITEAERDRGKWPAEKMLLFHYPFFKGIPNAVVELYQMDWKTKFLSLLAMPMVSSLLFLGMLLGFYVEINSPGFGFPGSVALMCLALIVLSSFALEVVDFLEVALMLIGVLFIALDLFLIPTFGILGLVGVIFFFIGLFGMMLPGIGSVEFELDTKTFNAAGEVFVQRLAWLCGTLVVGIVLIGLLGRYVMPNFSGFQHLVLSGHEETAADGYIAGIDPKTLPPVGSKGEVHATLRPMGKVLINEEIFEATTMGEYIEKGTAIKVVRLEGSVLQVQREEEV